MLSGSALAVVILAAGKGSRMGGTVPKVLQHLAHRSLLHWVLCAVSELQRQAAVSLHSVTVITGHEAHRVRAACVADALPSQLQDLPLRFAQQDVPLGTGHALQTAFSVYPDLAHYPVMVLCGDVPLLPAPLLCDFLNHVIRFAPHAMGVLSARVSDPTGFGRIIRRADSPDQVLAIVEENDTSEQQRLISEINTGVYIVPGSHVSAMLSALPVHADSGEYYLTDAVAWAVEHGVPITAFCAPDADAPCLLGANTRAQLDALERIYQAQARQHLCAAGVRFADPERVYIRGEVHAEPEVFIDIDVILAGRVVLGEGARVGPFTYLCDTQLGAHACIESHSHLVDTVVGANTRVGPFARLRNRTQLGDHCRIGNFVEIKAGTVGDKTAIAHLAYVGDAVLGDRVNWGAGSITCNYDGVRKHPTRVGAGSFVGSNVALVAPLALGENSFVAAGSTITQSVSAGALAIGRAKERHIPDWGKKRMAIEQGAWHSKEHKNKEHNK